jgi:hypothetical protein
VNNQKQRFFDTRGFRISVIAVLAVALLAGAAFRFGTGLRADTTRSVAPSPLGSSLTAVRESGSEDYVGRLTNSSAAVRSASLAALEKSRSDFYADLNRASAAARARRLGDRYDRMNSSSAAAGASQLGDRYDHMNSSSDAARSAAPESSRSDFNSVLNISSAADQTSG